MCYDDSARPPYPPVANGAAHGEELVLTADDGNRLLAYAAHPEQPVSAQVVIFPDARGLQPFYKELALRFAEIGMEAVAIDYYGRTAGLTARDDSFDPMPHLEQGRQSQTAAMQGLFADRTAALAYLHAGAGKERTTFTVGFCMGGALSFLTATTDIGVVGAIGFYASSTYEGYFLDKAEQIKYPVLGMFGDADHVIPVSDVRVFDEKLDKTGVEHKIIIYPGAPHAFFERQMVEYAGDAWQHMLEFINAHTPPTKS